MISIEKLKISMAYSSTSTRRRPGRERRVTPRDVESSRTPKSSPFFDSRITNFLIYLQTPKKRSQNGQGKIVSRDLWNIKRTLENIRAVFLYLFELRHFFRKKFCGTHQVRQNDQNSTILSIFLGFGEIEQIPRHFRVSRPPLWSRHTG